MTWSPPPGLLDKPLSSKDDQKWSPATEISSDLLLFLTTFVGSRALSREQPETQPSHCLVNCDPGVTERTFGATQA